MPDMALRSGDIISLSGFAPLIQLWAGICLLCFYEAFLNISPFRIISRNIRNLFMELLDSYKGYFPATPEDAVTYADDKWIKTKNAIKSISVVSFSGSVLLLAFAGIESTALKANYIPSIIVLDFFLLTYNAVAIMFFQINFFQKTIISVILSVTLAFYLIFCNCSVNEWLKTKEFVLFSDISYSKLVLRTLACDLSGIVSIVIVLGLRLLSMCSKKRGLFILAKRYEKLTNFLIYRDFNKLPKLFRLKLRWKISCHHKDILTGGKDIATLCINEIIENEYERFKYGLIRTYACRIWKKATKK